LKREEIFESIVKSNEIQFSRSKKNEQVGVPISPLPLLREMRLKKHFQRFDKNLNQNFHSLESNKIVEGCKSERVVREETFDVNFLLPEKMSVTGEITSIYKCPFQFL